jgi:uncharacterized membrane protein
MSIIFYTLLLLLLLLLLLIIIHDIYIAHSSKYPEQNDLFTFKKMGYGIILSAFGIYPLLFYCSTTTRC